MKEYKINFKKGGIRSLILFIVYVTAGFILSMHPEKTSYLAIRLIGVSWILVSFTHLLDIWIKYIEKY